MGQEAAQLAAETMDAAGKETILPLKVRLEIYRDITSGGLLQGAAAAFVGDDDGGDGVAIAECLIYAHALRLPGIFSHDAQLFGGFQSQVG